MIQYGDYYPRFLSYGIFWFIFYILLWHFIITTTSNITTITIFFISWLIITIFNAINRSKIRHQFHLKGGQFDDCIQTCFCLPCTQTQEYMQISLITLHDEKVIPISSNGIADLSAFSRPGRPIHDFREQKDFSLH